MAAQAAHATNQPLVYSPEPLPGEALYSLIARYRQHRALTHTALCNEMFGEQVRVFPINMPFRIGMIARRIPARFGLTPDRLILEHTGYRYYTAYSSDELRRRVAEEMAGEHGKAVATIGARAMPVGGAARLRFCPDCNVQAVKEHGEAYWLQAHQLPIVVVCPIHHTKLRISKLPASGIVKTFQVPDDRTCPDDAPAAVLRNEVDQGLLETLARDADTLLKGKCPDGIPRGWREDRLLQEARERGYRWANGNVNFQDLGTALADALAGITPVFPGIMEGKQLGPWFVRLREHIRADHTDSVLLVARGMRRVPPRAPRIDRGVDRADQGRAK